jgi:putative endonuclease
MNAKGGYVYMVSNHTRSVLYIGVTSDLYTRVYQHKNGEGSIFTKRYNCKDLVYYQLFSDTESAIKKEKQMKKWKRDWKDNLIHEFNPDKRDLFEEVFDCR